MRRMLLAPLLVISAGFGPCQGTTPSDKPSPPAPGATQASNPTPPPTPVSRKQQTLTVNARMKEHFAEGDLIRRALIVGDLQTAQKAGAWLASDEWTSNVRAAWKPHLAAVQSAGKHVADAQDLTAAARASAELAAACASCHESVGRPAFEPVALDSKAPAMAVHAWAVDSMWWGLFVPSDAAWKAGSAALSGAALVLSDVPAVEAIATQVNETARRGQTASHDQRGRIFSELLTTCASCHHAVGAELTLGDVALPHASVGSKRADESTH
jgi:cytochrome c553